MTLWLLALAFLLMCGCLAATLQRVSRAWIVAVVCVILTLVIYVLLSDVAIGVSL
jgi:lipopolysaccharide export LptBFGC system permease protein LptF